MSENNNNNNDSSNKNNNKNNNNETNVSTSELSLVINKAESIERGDGREEVEFEIKVTTETTQQLSMMKKSEDVIEEVIGMPDVIVGCEDEGGEGVNVVEKRKASIVIERQKSSENQNVPASISTQTNPTDEFPGPVLAINQDACENLADSSSTNEKHQQQNAMKMEAPEVDRKTKGIKKTKSRSIEEKDKKNSGGGGSKASLEGDEEELHHHHHHHHHKCYKLSHQQSQASQEEDFEIAMVTGLLPGCVGKSKRIEIKFDVNVTSY